MAAKIKDMARLAGVPVGRYRFAQTDERKI